MNVCLFLTSMSMNEDDGISQEMFSKKQIGYNTMKVIAKRHGPFIKDLIVTERVCDWLMKEQKKNCSGLTQITPGF